MGITGTLAVGNGGIGTTTLTDGGILLGSGTNAITAMSVLADGEIVIGDGTTDPVALAAFTASTGTLKHESGGIEANISAIADGGMLVGTGTGSMAIRASFMTAGAAGFVKHELGGLEFDCSAITTDQFLVGQSAGVIAVRTPAQTRTHLGTVIGTDVQAFGAILDDFNTLGAASTDGEFIVATGAGAFAYESGATARTSMGAIATVVEDTTPQLGGQLDVNGQALGNGTLELLTFTETASAVNHINITNNSTGNAPIVQAAGDNTDIDLQLRSKGTGNVVLMDDSGNQILVANDVASAINQVQIQNSAIGNAVQVSATGDDTNISLNLVAKGSGAVQANGVLITTVGKQTIWAPAAAMQPTASNGCAALAITETTAGRPDMQTLDFDTTADEHAQFSVAFPKSWNEGTITFKVFWTSTATDTDGVAWGLQGVAAADSNTIDVAYGTAIVVTDDNQSAAEDCLITAESSAMTIAGSPAAGELSFFRVFRDVSDANDDMTEDARLLGVQIFATTDAADDT